MDFVFEKNPMETPSKSSNSCEFWCHFSAYSIDNGTKRAILLLLIPMFLSLESMFILVFIFNTIYYFDYFVDNIRSSFICSIFTDSIRFSYGNTVIYPIIKPRIWSKKKTDFNHKSWSFSHKLCFPFWILGKIIIFWTKWIQVKNTNSIEFIMFFFEYNSLRRTLFSYEKNILHLTFSSKS